jgi:hypothetical protein
VAFVCLPDPPPEPLNKYPIVRPLADGLGSLLMLVVPRTLTRISTPTAATHILPLVTTVPIVTSSIEL